MIMNATQRDLILLPAPGRATRFLHNTMSRSAEGERIIPTHSRQTDRQTENRDSWKDGSTGPDAFCETHTFFPSPKRKTEGTGRRDADKREGKMQEKLLFSPPECQT